MKRASGRTARPPSLLAGNAVVGTGLAVELGSLFARTIILARLLGPHEFGVAAGMNTLAAVIEMISFVGLDRYLVYARDGHTEAALAAAHTLTLARGCIGFCLTVLLAWPSALLIHAGRLGPEFALLAVAPLLRGGVHLGVFQMQRAHRFLPAALAEALAAIAGLGVSTVFALRQPDHTAILWGLITQAAVVVVITHWSGRAIPYRFSWQRASLTKALRFGLPLTWNGAVLAASNQLDRVIVGGWLGPAALGLYSLSTTLLMQPMNLLMRFATTAWQPNLSAAWHSGRRASFTTLATVLNGTAMAIGGGGACIVACVGSPALAIVFGRGYMASDVFCAMFGGITAARLLRGTMNLLGLSVGATADLALCNSAGMACLPMIAVALAVQPSLEAAAIGGLSSEVIALAVTHLRLRRHYGRLGGAAVQNALLLCLLLAAFPVWTELYHPRLVARAATSLAGVAVFAVLALPAIFAARRSHQGGMDVEPASNLIHS